MKVRNLILGLAVAFAGFASLGEANAQKTFEKGTQTASIMIGLPSTTGLFSSIVVPPLTAVYEYGCLLYTSPSPRDPKTSRMPSSA